MPTLIVATDSERVEIDADRTEWDHNDTLICYDDGVAIAEFPNALWAARSENLE